MSSSFSSHTIASSAPVSCRVAFDAAVATIQQAETEATLRVALPFLAGTPSEDILPQAVPLTSTKESPVALYRDEASGQLAGFLVAPAALDLETAARHLYAQVFATSADLQLYRIWNYVPRINDTTDGLENYRRFCRGRSHAFEAKFGRGFERRLPAASAVGAQGGPLALAFLAGRTAPRHFENPQQIPAFEYPADYGPRSPSFSRATLVADGSQRTLFISGTAAIRGHVTIARDDLAGQLACTRDNLALIAETAGAGRDLGRVDGWRRSFKVYLRHADDLAVVRQDLDQHLVSRDDTITYLRSDICRSDLLVEIEAVLTRE